MTIVPITLSGLRRALADGWALAWATRRVSVAYAGVFALGGLVILGSLLANGLSPIVIAAAGAFMLLGPAVLAGFYGIAAAYDAGRPATPGDIVNGFRQAERSVWVLALVCALLFMIFVTDAAILYSYMVGGEPVWLSEALRDAPPGVVSYLQWGSVSGLFIAGMLYCVSAFSVPLLCERRASLVDAVTTSVRVVFGSFVPAMLWAALLATAIIGSILLLPLLPLTLPWLAYASRALYRQVLPGA